MLLGPGPGQRKEQDKGSERRRRERGQLAPMHLPAQGSFFPGYLLPNAQKPQQPAQASAPAPCSPKQGTEEPGEPEQEPATGSHGEPPAPACTVPHRGGRAGSQHPWDMVTRIAGPAAPLWDGHTREDQGRGGGSQQTAPEPTGCVAGRLRALLMQQRESASSASAERGLAPARASAGSAARRRGTARALLRGPRPPSPPGLPSSPSRSSEPVPAGSRHRLPLLPAGSSDQIALLRGPVHRRQRRGWHRHGGSCEHPTPHPGACPSIRSREQLRGEACVRPHAWQAQFLLLLLLPLLQTRLGPCQGSTLLTAPAGLGVRTESSPVLVPRGARPAGTDTARSGSDTLPPRPGPCLRKVLGCASPPGGSQLSPRVV